MISPKQNAAVHYAIQVLDTRGRVVREIPRKRNLILDQGLDGIAVRTWVAAFTYAVIGTGTTPTKRDSGVVTFTRAGSTVTASAGFFEAADVGRLLKWDTGEEARITAYTDAQTVTTSTAGAIAAAEGTIWYVNQTALVAESKRTNTYSTDGGANGSTFAGGTWTHKRTFIFAAEVAPVTYREIGWSHTNAAGANLFGRDVLAGAGVSLLAGQQLRVIVELAVAFSPAAGVGIGAIVTGWASAGTAGIVASHVSTVAANGNTSGQGGQEIEPSGAQHRVILQSDSTAIPAMGAGAAAAAVGVIAAKALTKAAYTAGSFTQDLTATFGVTEGNSAAIRSVSLCYNTAGTEYPSYRVLLAANEAKTSTYKLDLTFRLSWGRTLVN